MTDLNKEREICDQYFEKYWMISAKLMEMVLIDP